MSHYCNRHSQSPIRYKNSSNSKSAAQPDVAKIHIKIEHNPNYNGNNSNQKLVHTPNNLRGQQSESTHAGVSPLLQQKFNEFQNPAPFQFQNYVSNEGVPLRPQEIDQMKLRQEIKQREHELKLLAQMDYLLDLIKNLDQDRDVNIDTQKIEEIEKLKSVYQSINEEIQNLSFSQNLQQNDEKERRNSHQNVEQVTTPLGYSSIGGNNNEIQNPILAELGEDHILNSQNHSLPFHQQSGTQQEQQLQYNQNSDNTMQYSNRSGQSQRSNVPLQQSTKTNQSNQSKPNNQLIGSTPAEQIQQGYPNNNQSLIASTVSQQEQLFYLRMDNTLPENEQSQQQNQPIYQEDDKKSLLQSEQQDVKNKSFNSKQQQQQQQQSIQNSVHSQGSRKGDMAQQLIGSGVQSQSQQVANILIQSLPSNQFQAGYNPEYENIYNSQYSQPQMVNSAHHSHFSSVKQPQQQTSYHSIPPQQAENYSSQPFNQGSQPQNQGSKNQAAAAANLTGSYSLKNSQRNQYQSNPQQQQYMSPTQKLEQSIQTSLQLLNSQNKNPSSQQDQVDKNILEQQLQVYERQIKELIDENECLKKNIADSQQFKKVGIDSKDQTSFVSGNSRGSRGSFSQQIIIPTNVLAENPLLHEIQEALREKEADLQVLIQNITLEKDQNQSLIEENELLKTRLQNFEREAHEMQEQIRAQQLKGVDQGEVQGAYSSVGDSNYDSKPREDNQQQQHEQEDKRIQKEEEVDQQYLSRRLSELEQEQKQRSISFQEEINRYQMQITDLKEQLGHYHAQHVDYIGRFNQNKINSLVRKYEDIIETEAIKNMLSSNMQDTLGDTVSEQEIQIQKLERDLKEKQAEHAEEKAQLLEECKQKSAANDSLKEQIIQFKEQAEDQNNQIAYLNQEMQSIQQTFIEIEMKKDNLILENNELKTRIDQLEDVRNQEISLKEDAIKHITELQHLLEQKHSEIDQLTQQRDSIKAEYDELLKSLNEMEYNLQAVQESFTYNRNQHELFKRETQELRQTIAQTEPLGQDQEDEEIRQSIQDLKKELNIQDEDDQNQDEHPKHTKHTQNDYDNKNGLRQSQSSKHSHHHSSVHNSARFMKESVSDNQQRGQFDEQYKGDVEQELKNSQNLNNYENQEGYGENEGEGEEVEGCEDCDRCQLEEMMMQNEQLKQQLLLKEKEIIELKTNPVYYAKTQAQMNSINKTPFSAGKGQYFIETNDSIINNRVYESPIGRQPHTPHPFTSPQPNRGQVEQQQGRISISNSKMPEQLSSSQKQQQLSNSAQQYQSYSVLQSEIEHLQKIFDQKCKEVDSWKKTYQQFYDN